MLFLSAFTKLFINSSYSSFVSTPVFSSFIQLVVSPTSQPIFWLNSYFLVFSFDNTVNTYTALEKFVGNNGYGYEISSDDLKWMYISEDMIDNAIKSCPPNTPVEAFVLQGI